MAKPGRRLGINRFIGIGMVGSVVSLLFCGTMLTPLLAGVLVAIGLGALAQHVEGLVMGAFAAFAVLALFGCWVWWRHRRRAAQVANAAPC
jgi:hypothetical protein